MLNFLLSLLLGALLLYSAIDVSFANVNPHGLSKGQINIECDSGFLKQKKKKCSTYKNRYYNANIEASDNIGNVVAVREVEEEDVEIKKGHDPSVAIAFLIDTSDPRRVDDLEYAKKISKEIIDDLPKYAKVGVYSFDSILYKHTVLGSSYEENIEAIDSLKATGETTELYKSTRDLIDFIKDEKAGRKIIVLISDGKKEDKAYDHEEVVRVANENHVNIFGIALLEKNTSIDRQFIERLAYDTSGTFIHTRNKEIPQSYIDEFNDAIKPKTIFLIDFENVSKEANTIMLYLTFPDSDDEKVILKQIPIEKDIPVNLFNNKFLTWFAITLGIIFLLSLFYFLYKFLMSYFFAKYKVISQDNNKSKRIMVGVTRVGRNKKSNDIVIQNDSVSKCHAEIRVSKEGDIVIEDVGSSNGTYINDKEVLGVKEVSSGDKISFGQEEHYLLEKL